MRKALNMPKARERQEPIRQSVRVDCPIEEAFQLFSESFGEWWPLASYSISGDEADSCVIEPWIGGRIFERTRSGEEHDWGSVTVWNPPEHLRFTWDPGGAGDRNQTVDVEFRVDADGTRVTLIHTGWEAPGVAVCSLATASTDVFLLLLQQYFAEFATQQMLALA
jgi:uncharacterized protein YndB with AHSA1/START domain